MHLEGFLFETVRGNGLFDEALVQMINATDSPIKVLSM
jgi:hypothetical protein